MKIQYSSNQLKFQRWLGMKKKCLYFGKHSDNSPMGMKIRFRAHDEKVEEEDLEPKSFYKSAENF